MDRDDDEFYDFVLNEFGLDGDECLAGFVFEHLVFIQGVALLTKSK